MNLAPHQGNDLAASINAEHAACVACMGEALDHAMLAGDLLKQAKRACPHGHWQGWLKTHFDGSPRTARVCMQLARHRDFVERERQSTADLSIAGALARLPVSPLSEKELRERDRFEQTIEDALAGMVAAFDAMALVAPIRGETHRQLYDRHFGGQDDSTFDEYREQVEHWRQEPWYEAARQRVAEGAAA